MSKINTPNQDTPSYFLASADIFERLAAVISMRMRVPGDVQGHAGQSVIIVPQACSQGNRPRFVIILQYATHMLPAATLAFSSSLYGGFTQTMMHHKWVFDCRWDASSSFHFLLRSSPPPLLYQPHYGSMSFRNPLVPVRIQFSESVHCWGKCQCGFRGDAVPVFTSYYHRFVCPNTLLETMRRPRRPKNGHNSQNCQKRQWHLTKTWTSLKKTTKEEWLVMAFCRPGSFLLSPTQLDQSSINLKDRKWWKLLCEKAVFCSEIDSVPSDVSGLVGGGGGQGWRLITDIREVIGLLFSNWCLQASNGDDIYEGGSGPTHSLLPGCISHIHEEGEQQGDGWNPGLFSSGARRTSMTPLTTNWNPGILLSAYSLPLSL